MRGYVTPLFLGGADVVGNLELTDTDVYWQLTSQLIRQASRPPEGTPVARVEYE
jgi:hypothetical protein